jgi:hypothetical protein
VTPTAEQQDLLEAITRVLAADAEIEAVWRSIPSAR